MEIIKYLGNQLAKKINISPPATRGLLKLAIKDELGPFKPLNQINFNDLKSVIENTLKLRLKKLEIPNSEILVEYLLHQLTKNQSLITMAGV
jgi:hypothetical protein